MSDYEETERSADVVPPAEQSADGYIPEVSPVEPSESEATPNPQEAEAEISPDTLGAAADSSQSEDAPLDSDEEPEDVDRPAAEVPLCAESETITDQKPYEAPCPTKKPENWLQKTWRQHRAAMVLSSVCLLLAVLFLGGIAYVYFVIHPYESYDKILPNVYCAGVNLGGMTREEAQDAIEEALRHPSYSLKLILPDCEYEFHPTQEGVTLNGAQVAQLAFSHGREDPSAYGVYKAYHSAKRNKYRLNAKTDLIYSLDDIEALAKQIEKETYIAPTECTASYDEEKHVATLTLGEPGRRIQAETIVDAVDAAFDDMTFEDISLDYEKVEIDMRALRTLTGTCREEYSSAAVDPVITANEEDHTIDLTMGTLGWKLNGNALYALAEEAVEQESYGTVSLELESIQPTDVDITDAYKELAGDPVEPYYYGGEVLEGTDGYTLDWEKAIADILASDYGETLSIPMTPIPPKHTAQEVRDVLFRDQLSKYSSPHVANSNRTYNLSLACQAINGTVINAGEVFSFNGVVGERTAAKGYRAATVYVGTESKEETGGGICQVASTIYDAALYAEMEIVSREEHTFFVTYVPGGLDATVYWGSLDFSFRNNTEYPIRVNASVSGGYVNISIDGTKTNDHVVKLSSSQLSSTPYSTVYKNDSSKPAGYQQETVSPYTGYTYEAYQYIYDGNGNLLDTVYLGKSTYQKRDRVITVGTG